MMAMAGIAMLVMVTLAATAAAVLLDWILLRAAFSLMRPAAARPALIRKNESELVRGTAQLVRIYAGR